MVLDYQQMVKGFLNTYLLHWLEALALLGQLAEGLYLMKTLQSFYHGRELFDIYRLVYDRAKFLFYFCPAIEVAPLQIYYSALVFSPTQSTVRKRFAHELPSWICRLPKVEADWDCCIRTLDRPELYDLIFSPDSQRLILFGNGIHLYDLATETFGSMVQADPKSSRHGCSLLDRFFFYEVVDETVMVQEIGREMCPTNSSSSSYTVPGVGSDVRNVCISSRGRFLATMHGEGEDNKNGPFLAVHLVKLWELPTGRCCRAVPGRWGCWMYPKVDYFSPNERFLALKIRDNDQAEVWDLEGTRIHRFPCDRRSHWIFNPRGDRLAIASGSTNLGHHRNLGRGGENLPRHCAQK
jgi:WD40 repeat protein